MSLAVNRVNNISFRANETQKAEQKSPETSQKSGLSDGEKIMAGLGAMAAITLGGILVKRRLDVKAAEKIAKRAQELLQKPREFTDETFKSLMNEWKNSGKLDLDAGDEIFFMNKNALLEGWDDYHAKLHSAMKLSDNGFAIVVTKNGNKNGVVKYYDPKEITSKYINKAINSKDNIVKFNFE